jgi:hypothetical protein
MNTKKAFVKVRLPWRPTGTPLVAFSRPKRPEGVPLGRRARVEFVEEFR